MKKATAFGILMAAAGLLMTGYLWGATTSPTAPPATNPTVKVRDDKARREYVNMSRISMGPQAEEVILDLGIMSYDDTEADELDMDISTHVYMTVIGAKKLNLSLSQALERYEEHFGTIEVDVHKRMKKP